MNDKPLTLEEYSKTTLADATRRFAAAAIEENLRRSDLLEDMVFYGYTPPTRRQRLLYRLKDIRQRAKDIWTILRGGDVHEDCGC